MGKGIRFFARNVPVLNFSYRPDRSGQVIPPEAHVTYPKSLWVYFEEMRNPIGAAKLRRQGNVLIADMDLITTWDKPSEAYMGIKGLTPCIAGTIVDAHEQTITHMNLTYLILSRHGNADVSLEPIGNKLRYLKAMDAN